MKQDELLEVQEAISQGEFSLPDLQYEWLSPLCCVAWDATTSTLTIGDDLDCQVLSYSVAARLADFLERHLPEPSEALEV